MLKTINQYPHTISFDIPSKTDTIVIKNGFGNIDITCDAKTDKITGNVVLNSFSDQEDILDFVTEKSTVFLGNNSETKNLMDLSLTLPANMQIQIYNKTGEVRLENARKPIVADMVCGTLKVNNIYSDIDVKLHIGKVILKNTISNKCNVIVNMGTIYVDRKQLDKNNSVNDFKINIGKVDYI